MIEAIYWKNHNRLTVRGHAYSAEEGKDLVCAGASTLAVTLATNVRVLVEMGYARDPIIELDKGEAIVQCTPLRKYSQSVGQVFRSVCVGFEILAVQYPEYISYQVRG